MDFSEYETASEFEQDFESDHEPPKDQLFLKKMVHKSQKLRIYKSIAKIGKSYLEMPAKFDQVVLRIKKMNDNSLEKNLQKEIEKDTFENSLLADFCKLEALSSTPSEDFESETLEQKEAAICKEQELLSQLKRDDKANVRVLRMGVDFRSDALVLSVANMKKGEISFFEVEEVGYHEKTKERKLFGTQYYLVELIDFITIIDIFGDEQAYKIQLDKGKGIRRVNKADGIQTRLALKNSLNETLWEFQNIDKGKAVIPFFYHTN